MEKEAINRGWKGRKVQKKAKRRRSLRHSCRRHKREINIWNGLYHVRDAILSCFGMMLLAKAALTVRLCLRQECRRLLKLPLRQEGRRIRGERTENREEGLREQRGNSMKARWSARESKTKRPRKAGEKAEKVRFKGRESRDERPRKSCETAAKVSHHGRDEHVHRP